MRNAFDVAKALRETQTIVKTLANKKAIRLEFEGAADLPPLFADEAKFKQIMYNLLSNAIKFTPDGGTVLVNAAIQNGAGAGGGDSIPAGECLRVAVADTGIGIKPNDQQRVFKEFEQVDSSYGRLQQGTGLGLALTRRLVELHGGRIWVESEGVEGKGSTFIFLIPFSQAKAGTQPQADALEPPDDTILHSDKAPGRKLSTVLIIDDEPALLELLTRTLLQKGFNILRTTDGRRGAELATTYRPDVIILDYSMPEFGGAQVVEQLRANPRTKDIPILIHTGAVLNEQERQQLAGHVQAIASKTDRGSLLAELERLDAARAGAVATGATS